MLWTRHRQVSYPILGQFLLGYANSADPVQMLQNAKSADPV